MHHLLRPSLYSAYHKIVPLFFDESRAVKNFDVVGPICESSDVVGFDRNLQVPEEGEWFAVMDTGAYGMSMASAYNLHQFPDEVLVL
jgi:diaminopimelate decarboxylase